MVNSGQTINSLIPKALPLLAGKLPAYTSELNGSNSVTIINPNEFGVLAVIQQDEKGRNFYVPSGGNGTVGLPNGSYQIYFVYSNRSESPFQGDGFTLNYNRIEIQIVKVPRGNYHIWEIGK